MRSEASSLGSPVMRVVFVPDLISSSPGVIIRGRTLGGGDQTCDLI